jgi:hypothetical protein
VGDLLSCYGEATESDVCRNWIKTWRGDAPTLF